MSWNKEWFPYISTFPKGYWTLKINQRNFLDNLASKLNIEEPRDWGSITIHQVSAHGGITLLGNYQQSLFRTLKSVYPGFSLS